MHLQISNAKKILFRIFLHILPLQVCETTFMLFQCVVATSDTNFVF